MKIAILSIPSLSIALHSSLVGYSCLLSSLLNTKHELYQELEKATRGIMEMI